MRIAAAVEAGDHVHAPVDARFGHAGVGVLMDPERIARGKPPAPSAADISVDNRKMLWCPGNTLDDRLDFRGEAGGQLCTPSPAPIASFDKLGPCGRTKDNRQHNQRRYRRSALSWSHEMLRSRS